MKNVVKFCNYKSKLEQQRKLDTDNSCRFWIYFLILLVVLFYKVQFLLKNPKKCLKDLKRMNTIWVGITLDPRFQKLFEKKRQEVVIGYGSK